MGLAVNEVPTGFTNSLAAAHREKEMTDAEFAGLKAPSFYQQLVRHFYDRREPHLFFWNTVCENYHQKQWHGEDDRDILDEVRSGDVYALVHTTEAMVFNRRPKLFLEGWHGRIQSDNVPILEKALNNEWYKDYRLVKEVRLAIRDCIKTGWGAVISSYDAEFDPIAQRAEADKERQLAADSPLTAAALDEVDAQAAMTSAEQPGPEYAETFEADSRVVKEQINTRRVSPFDLLVDPEARCLEDAKWCGRRIFKSLAAVKADSFLKNTGSLKPTSEMEKVTRGGRKTKKDEQDPYDYVEMYEIWERIFGGGWRYILIAKDHPKHLKVVDNPLWIGCPLRLLRWNDDGEEIFAQSDCLPVWPTILAKTILRTKMLDGYAREHMDTTFFDKNAGVSEEDLNAVGDPVNGKYVPVKSANNRRLADIFFKPQKDPKSPEGMNMLAMFEREFQISSGMGPNQMGQALKSATSATESNEIASFARARGDHKFGATEEFVAGIAADRLGLMWQFYKKDRMVKIAGAEAAKAWPKNRVADDVRNALFVRVDQGSMRPQDDPVRVQQKIQAIQILGQIPGAVQMINMPVFLRELLRDLGFHDGHKAIYEPEQLAMMMQLQELMAQSQGGQEGAPGEEGAEAGPDGEPRESAEETPTTSGGVSQAQRGKTGGGVAA